MFKLFGVGQPKPPLPEASRRLIEESFLWFGEQFTWAPAATPTIIPTRRFFPPAWTASDEDIDALLILVCRLMEIEPERIHFEFFEEDESRSSASMPSMRASGAGRQGSISIRSMRADS